MRADLATLPPCERLAAWAGALPAPRGTGPTAADLGAERSVDGRAATVVACAPHPLPAVAREGP